MQSFIFQVRHFPPPAVWSVIFQCCIFNAPLNHTQSGRPREYHRKGMEVQDNAQISDASICKNIDVSFPYRYVESYLIGHLNVDFYSASALLAMQSAVIARGIPSVCSSVCPSVTFRYCVQTNDDTIVRFSASGRTISLVSGEVKFISYSRGFKMRHPSIDSEN